MFPARSQVKRLRDDPQQDRAGELPRLMERHNGRDGERLVTPRRLTRRTSAYQNAPNQPSLA
jgi:hypothetical protein